MLIDHVSQSTINLYVFFFKISDHVMFAWEFSFRFFISYMGVARIF